VSVSKVGGGEVVFTAAAADRCGSWAWSLSGPVAYYRSGGTASTCIDADHSWDTRWNTDLTLPDGTYTVTLTIANTAGSTSGTRSFTMP